MSEPNATRKIDDPHALRALAHPVRLDLLEAVSLHGPLTATAAAALVGESPANCSWHLRQLAKYGYIEPAPGATGRERPWQRVRGALEWGANADDPALEAAAHTLTDLFVDREVRLIRTAMNRPQPPDWDEAVLATMHITWLTAEELSSLGEQLVAVLATYRGRADDPAARPPGSRPVRLLALGAADDSLLSTPEPGDTDV